MIAKTETKRLCGFVVEVYMDADQDKSRVEVGCDLEPIPFAALMTATEHMMTLCALESQAGFEKALELLVIGALSNKVNYHVAASTSARNRTFSDKEETEL